MLLDSRRTVAASLRALLVACASTAVLACGGDGGSGSSGGDPTSPVGGGSAAARVASLDSIRIPLPAGAGIDPLQQWETNAGLYFLVVDPSAAFAGAGSTILRYNPAGGGSFQTAQTPVYASAIRPARATTDGTAFSTYWVSTPSEQSGQVSVNSGLPSRVMEFSETGFLHEIIPDPSSTARDWATGLDDDANWRVVRMSASVGAEWTTIARPAGLGEATARAAAMPNGKLYLGVGKQLYVIANDGIERTIPLAGFGNGPIDGVNKVIGVDGGTSVYFGYGSRVFRLSTSGTEQPTEVISARFPNPLGAFCVNSGRVYTSDGMKSPLNGLGAASSYIQSSGTVPASDEARLSRIQGVLAAGNPMCLNQSSTISAAVFVASGGWLFRIGSI